MDKATRLQKANQLLAPYAVPHEGILGRITSEPDDETRFPFQRDRDRIIHSQAFRRLLGKTQVFIAGEGDHYRTRLTHTMEVAQISRDIARTLLLNEDLAECIALAHDLGHPPFGHAGEEALDEWLTDHDQNFEHNEQSFRIVTLLEEHSSEYPGLNLNCEVLNGLLKHTTPYDNPLGKDPVLPSLEAQIVNLADEIAYTGHDCDDALRADMFGLDAIRNVGIVKQALRITEQRKTSLRGGLIHLLVTDLYETSTHALKKITSLKDVHASKTPLIRFSPDMKSALEELRTFLWEHLYLHASIQERNAHGKKTVKELCDALYKNPPQKVIVLQQRTRSTFEEAIKDYVAGMTDAYAMKTLESFA